MKLQPKTLEQLEMEVDLARTGFIECVAEGREPSIIDKWRTAYMLASDRYADRKYAKYGLDLQKMREAGL